MLSLLKQFHRLRAAHPVLLFVRAVPFYIERSAFLQLLLPVSLPLVFCSPLHMRRLFYFFLLRHPPKPASLLPQTHILFAAPDFSAFLPQPQTLCVHPLHFFVLLHELLSVPSFWYLRSAMLHGCPPMFLRFVSVLRLPFQAAFASFRL